MPKITRKEKVPTTERKVIIAKTRDKVADTARPFKWWMAQNENELCRQLIATAGYLQKMQQWRIKQASIFSRVYSGKPLINYALNSKLLDTSNQLPADRPTMNVAQSCVDTLVSRITQSRPRPVFLTEQGDYRERRLAKQMNFFVAGELYRNKAYDQGTSILRDACVLGDGLFKILEVNKKVALERTLETEVFADSNDAWNGAPRSKVQLRLIDRSVAEAIFPKAKFSIEKAQRAQVDGTDESSNTIADQLILVEAWHLPSKPGAKDGRHSIVCSAGQCEDERYTKDFFPFVQLGYNPNMVGIWSQGLVQQLLGTQVEINKILITISQAINLVGVPRVFVNEMSKVVEAQLNNMVGAIIKYRGEKPSYEVAQCIPSEMYEHLQRLVSYAYQQSGISALSAAAQKPMGLNSGAAIRSFDDLQTDRFAALARRYDQMYVELAYQIVDLAKDIAERDGSYTTVFPDKDGTREVDLPKAGILKDTYVIQCHDESSLPRDPAGRYARLSEMLASQEITLQEFRRLMSLPDLEQSDRLANALMERIFQALDKIIEDGKFTTPDPFMMDPTDIASKLTVNYINLYSQYKLEESKMQLLRDFFSQLGALKAKALQPPPAALPAGPSSATDPNAAPPPEAAAAPISEVSPIKPIAGE